jgi:hypothetical protein
MGLFSPKYPPGAEPPAKPKRQSQQQRLDAAVAAADARQGVVDDAWLRRVEGEGAKVTRHAGYITVQREIPGGYSTATYDIQGGGRYKAPRNHRR